MRSDKFAQRTQQGLAARQQRTEQALRKLKTGAKAELAQLTAGLMRILAIALRVLTLLEFVARRQLSQQVAPLQGLYAGNPKRATLRPTTERLLQAFADITL